MPRSPVAHTHIEGGSLRPQLFKVYWLHYGLVRDGTLEYAGLSNRLTTTEGSPRVPSVLAAACDLLMKPSVPSGSLIMRTTVTGPSEPGRATLRRCAWWKPTLVVERLAQSPLCYSSFRAPSDFGDDQLETLC